MPSGVKIVLTTVYFIWLDTVVQSAIIFYFRARLCREQVKSFLSQLVLRSIRTDYQDRLDRHHVVKQNPIVFRKGKRKPAADIDTHQSKESGPSTNFKVALW